jgi:spore maturation protein CgeB
VRWVVAQPGPSFSVHDTYVGWVEALRNLGQHVVEFNLDERLTLYASALKQIGEGAFQRMLTGEQSYELAVNGLYSTLYKARPDFLLVVSGFFIPPELLDRARRSGTRTIVLHTESPYEDERMMTLAPLVDLLLIDDPTHLEEFQTVTRTAYVPKAHRPTLHCPGPPVPELESDLAFVGTGYQSRIDFLEAMDLDGVDVLLAGNWAPLTEDSKLYPFVGHDPEQCLPNERTVDVYRSAKVGLNLYRREAQRPELSAGWSMGPREVEMAAIGLPFARDPRGEGDAELPMLPTFTDPAEASEIVRWFLTHDDEREKASLAIREAVAWRTFTHHAEILLQLLDA